MPVAISQGVVAGSSPTTVGFGRRCLLMGDSITQNCNTLSLTSLAWPNQVVATTNESWWGWAMRLTGQRLTLDPSLNKGVGGDTTALMLARFSTDVMANLNSFDIMFLMAGTNDINTGLLSAVPFANIQNMVQQVKAKGKQVVLITPPPMGSADAPSSSQILNYQSLCSRLRDWVKTQPEVVFVDVTRAYTDPTSGTNGYALAALDHGDGIHPSGGGAYRIGQMIANSLNILLPPANELVGSQADLYDATNNPNGNRCVNGSFTVTSGGTINAGSGTLAANWELQKQSGTFVNAEVVASVVTGTQGVNAISGNTQHLVVNMSAKTSNESFFFISLNSIQSFVPGDVVYAECVMNISGISNMWYAQLGILDSDGAQFPTTALDGYDPYGTASANLNLWDPQTYTGMVFRTPNYTIVKGTQIYVKCQFAFNATVSAGATIDIQGMTIRKVN